ncbi:helix-turn-helix domain-containing protein [Paenibacillus dakarensis]|uniref:helix-turn-helix domain-containing protein n=1 Tax=Paenibacillus dakarensis TaxID=1527293 RepID=UPI0006D584DD
MPNNIDIRSIVAANVIALRKSKNLTQQEFGKLLSLGKTTISQWENASKLPNATSINKLIEMFDLNSETLFKVDGIRLDTNREEI